MILHCDVKMSSMMKYEDRKHSGSFVRSVLGIAEEKKRYFLVINNKSHKTKFILNKQNIIVHSSSIEIKHPKRLMLIRDADANLLTIFMKLLNKLLSNKSVPKLMTVEDVFKVKILQSQLKFYRKNENSIINQIDSSPSLKNLSLQSINLTRLILNRFHLFASSLTALEMKECKLEKIPYEITQLKKLMYLSLNDNLITEIPRWFSFEMQQLIFLNFENNHLKSIPFEFGFLMDKCQTINLSKNRLRAYPASILHLEKVKRDNNVSMSVDFAGNPIPSLHLRPSILNQDLSELFALQLKASNAERKIRRPNFKPNSLYRRCLTKIISWNKTNFFLQLFDWKITPLPIYKEIQNLLFFCNTCNQPSLVNCGIYNRPIDQLLHYHRPEVTEHLFLYGVVLTCMDCDNNLSIDWSPLSNEERDFDDDDDPYVYNFDLRF